MKKINSVCVYCSSRDEVKESFKETARNVGEIFANEDITLVYGGAEQGLMGETADSTLKHGGKVIGVIPEVLVDRESAHSTLTEQHFVKDMHARKMLMAEKSDAFLVIPGGYGTMDETFEIITWKYLGLHNKPVIILNTEGFYKPFIDMVDHFVEHKVVREDERSLFTVVETIEEIVPTLKTEIESSSDYMVSDHM